jgi:hypothetical protein
VYGISELRIHQAPLDQNFQQDHAEVVDVTFFVYLHSVDSKTDECNGFSQSCSKMVLNVSTMSALKFEFKLTMTGALKFEFKLTMMGALNFKFKSTNQNVSIPSQNQ